MKESLETIVDDLETVEDADRLNYILDKGADAVGEGDLHVTRDQYEEVVKRSDEIHEVLSSGVVASDNYFEQLRAKTEEYSNEVNIFNQDEVVDRADDMLEEVNPNRTVIINAAGLVYATALLTNNRINEDGEKITQSLLSDETGVSRNAIREAYQDIFDNAY
jgi:CRISPR/Cas system CMR subunit Cmr4 (Cas7 group RAMP superfamily)